MSMGREERVEDIYAVMRYAMEGLRTEIQTSIPAIIQSFDPDKRTCTAQPAIRYQMTNYDNTKKWVTLPIIVDIPVIFPSGGGYTLTFPIKQGDECLLVFASRCIDAWWYSSGVQNQDDIRFHDYSDGFALVGVNSRPKVIPNISTNSVQLRADSGADYIEIANDKINVVSVSEINLTSSKITLNASSKIVLETPLVEIAGNITTTGTLGAGTANFAGEGTFNNHTVGQHTHSDPQGGTVSLPTG